MSCQRVTACFSCRASLLVARSASSDRACSCKHSLMNSRCVLDSCCSGLWSSFKHLAGFLKLKRMPWVEPFVHQASDRHRRGAVGTSTRAVACDLTNICFTKLKRFTFFFKKKKNDPGSDVFVFLGNKPVSRRSTCPRSTPPQQQPSARPDVLTRNQVKKNTNTRKEHLELPRVF